MKDYILGVMETRFAEIMWENAPIASGDLVRLCEKELGWKKSTTYTMLRRLCQRNIFQNQDSIISALMSKQDFHAIQSEQFIDETFGGSLPQFLATFTTRKKLSESDIDGLKKLIDKNEEE